MLEPELWRTVRVAICGWAPTVRLVIVLVVITICWIAVMTPHGYLI